MDIGILHKNWVHSHEEDTEGEIVYRPDTYALSPLRGGRDAIELKPDNSFTQRGDMEAGHSNQGPDDRYNYAHGHWRIDENNILSLTGDENSPAKKLKVLSLDNDKLVIQK